MAAQRLMDQVAHVVALRKHVDHQVVDRRTGDPRMQDREAVDRRYRKMDRGDRKTAVGVNLERGLGQAWQPGTLQGIWLRIEKGIDLRHQRPFPDEQ